MTTKRTNPSCRPGTTDAMQRLADENEALRAERDKLAARAERLEWAAGHFDQVDECEQILAETPAQSVAHIKAAGAREALQRAITPGFSDTVVRVDALQAVIEKMEGES